MTLKVDVQQKAGRAYVVYPSGSLDSSTYNILEQEIDALLKKTPAMVVLDMEHLEYLSSAGVRVIFKTQKILKEGGGKLVFMNLQPQIRKVFDIINALPSLQVFGSVAELDEYLDVMQKKAKTEDFD